MAVCLPQTLSGAVRQEQQQHMPRTRCMRSQQHRAPCPEFQNFSRTLSSDDTDDFLNTKLLPIDNLHRVPLSCEDRTKQETPCFYRSDLIEEDTSDSDSQELQDDDSSPLSRSDDDVQSDDSAMSYSSTITHVKHIPQSSIKKKLTQTRREASDGNTIEDSCHTLPNEPYCAIYAQQQPLKNKLHTSEPRNFHRALYNRTIQRSLNNDPPPRSTSRRGLSEAPQLKDLFSSFEMTNASPIDATPLLRTLPLDSSVVRLSSTAPDTSAPTEENNLLLEAHRWVDSIPLSRPRKHLGRDFSDAVLLAELIHHFKPHWVDLHNYSPANARTHKIHNWDLLNRKVFKKRLPFVLSDETIEDLVDGKSQVIEALLLQLKHTPQLQRQKEPSDMRNALLLPRLSKYQRNHRSHSETSTVQDRNRNPIAASQRHPILATSRYALGLPPAFVQGRLKPLRTTTATPMYTAAFLAQRTAQGRPQQKHFSVPPTFPIPRYNTERDSDKETVHVHQFSLRESIQPRTRVSPKQAALFKYRKQVSAYSEPQSIQDFSTCESLTLMSSPSPSLTSNPQQGKCIDSRTVKGGPSNVTKQRNSKKKKLIPVGVLPSQAYQNKPHRNKIPTTDESIEMTENVNRKRKDSWETSLNQDDYTEWRDLQRAAPSFADSMLTIKNRKDIKHNAKDTTYSSNNLTDLSACSSALTISRRDTLLQQQLALQKKQILSLEKLLNLKNLKIAKLTRQLKSDFSGNSPKIASCY